MSETRATLVTIGPSHFCEKARWALDRADVPYVEEPHAPLMHLAATIPRGGRSTPLLVTSDRVLRDSTEIVAFADERLPEPKRLFPAEPALRAEVSALEDRFDDELGPHVRRWAYGHLLDDPVLVRATLAPRVPRRERILLRAGRPLIVRVMKRGMRITPESCRRSLGKVQKTFADVDARLADGRAFLTGDRFTAADLALAALAAPALAVPEYGAPRPGLEQVPAAMRQEIETFRATRTGQFVLRVYRDLRRRVSGAAAGAR